MFSDIKPISADFVKQIRELTKDVDFDLSQPLMKSIVPNFCHIYSAEARHEDAMIIADTNALLKLKATIELVLQSSTPEFCELFPADAEGFSLWIACVDSPELQEKLQLPYTDDIAKDRNPNKICPTSLFY